jgi:hypothetical protein
MLSLPKFGAPSGFENPGVRGTKKTNRNKIQEISGAPANRANDCCSCAISFRGPRLDGRKGPLGACSDAESEFLATLAFAMPLIAMLAAMSLSGIGRPTVAQLRAKRAALLAVAAPTLFTFVGVVLYMLRDPVPDTWLWVPCWAIVLPLLLWSDNDAPARVVAPRCSSAPARRPRRVGARPRDDLPGAPHRQPLDVPRRRRNV